MRNVALVLLALAACEAEPTLAPVDQAAPPLHTDLWAGSVVIGDQLPVIVEGANPYDTLVLYGSVTGRGAGPCPGPFGGLCLNIVRPMQLTRLVADAHGRAEAIIPIPHSFRPDRVLLQAIGGGWINSYKTPIVVRQTQRTPPLPLHLGLTDPPEEAYTHLGAEIEGDTLFVDLEYSGGCVDHEFFAQWDGSFAESLPEQVYIELIQRPSNDPCDGIIQETVRVDIRTVRLAAPNTPILVNINGDQAVYDFL